METFTTKEQIREYAISKGYKAEKLDAKFEVSYLPKEGKFIGFDILPVTGDNMQFRMYTTDGGTISIGTIRAMAFDGAKENVVIAKSTNNPKGKLFGKFVMKGTSRINPQFGQGDMIDLAVELMNRRFTTDQVERWTLLYNDKGYNTEAEAKEHLVFKKFYKIDLIPEAKG